MMQSQRPTRKKQTKSDKERTFIRIVRAHYRNHGRHDLPWRLTTDPYRILVSEVMLQQTQVPRVILKYDEFLKQFPNVRALARAPLGDVLRAWQGLGYNRRARYLWESAREVMSTCGGAYPGTYQELLHLPGVGPYTAGAIMAFAYNEPTAIIETNIRTVYLHHFFSKQRNVADAALLPYIDRTLDRGKPREWYAALMDYGAYLKHTEGNQNSRSRHYTKQSRFAGSDRQIRGAVLRTLAERDASTRSLARMFADTDSQRVREILCALEQEGMVVRSGNRYRLPE